MPELLLELHSEEIPARMQVRAAADLQRLVVEGDRIVDYRLRQPDQKRQAVRAFHGLEYRVIAAGDSYNDTTMLGEADAGFLFHAPANVIEEFPQFPAVHSFAELKQQFLRASNRALSL